MDPKKLTHWQIKRRQVEDMRNKVCNYTLLREISTPFTYLFVKLGISPNVITLSSIILVLIGFYFLSIGDYLNFIVGLLFFVLFKIFDNCDGEVARIQKSRSIEGVFYDRISHYAFALTFGLGFSIGGYHLTGQEFSLFLGILLTFVLVMENAMRDSVQLFLMIGIRTWKKFDFTKDMKAFSQEMHSKFTSALNKGKSWNKGNIISKIASIYPYQGLMFNDTFIIILTTALTIVDYVLMSTANITVQVSKMNITLTMIYFFLLFVSKSIWIVWYISQLVKRRPITETLKNM